MWDKGQIFEVKLSRVTKQICICKFKSTKVITIFFPNLMSVGGEVTKNNV